MRCLICHRLLKDPESIARQMGNVCYCRLHPKQNAIHLNKHAELSELDEARQYKLDFSKANLQTVDNKTGG